MVGESTQNILKIRCIVPLIKFLNAISEIDIERCVQDSIKIFQSTPKSVTERQYDNIHPSSEKHEGKIKSKMVNALTNIMTSYFLEV